MELVGPIAVFLGTIIGVGIFSLPFIAMKAGFFICAAYLAGMAIVSYKIHDFYAKIAISTPGNHRLPGYTERWLGKNWKSFSFFINAVGSVCALLAYLIVGGQFLFNIFSIYFGGSYLFYFIVFLLLGALAILKEIKMILKIELALLLLIILIMALIFISAAPRISSANLLTFNADYLFFPFGAVIFSLWGASIIPELKEMILKKSKNPAKILKRTVFLGIMISALIYFVFVLSVLGVSGKNTSSEAASGLVSLGLWIVWISSFLGFICCFTSYITIGLTLKKSLEYDFKVKRLISWILTIAVPVVIYFLGAREFIKIIGFAGTISIGFEALLIILIYRECFKSRIFKIERALSYILSAIFIIGIILEIYYFLV